MYLAQTKSLYHTHSVIMAAALATQSSRILDAVQVLLTGGGAQQPPRDPSEPEKKRNYLCYDALNDKYITCIEIKKGEKKTCGMPAQQYVVSSSLPRMFDALVLSYKLRQPVLVANSSTPSQASPT